MKNKINTLKSKVEYCLGKYERTRNSDQVLTNAVWTTFYSQYFEMIDDRAMIYVRDIYNLPPEAHIGRIRRKFNEKGKYLPTDPEVRRKRKVSEEAWREWSQLNL